MDNDNKYISRLAPMAVSIEEAAQISGMGRQYLTKLVYNDKTFPAFKRGTKVLVYVDGLREYIRRKALRRDGFAEFS